MRCTGVLLNFDWRNQVLTLLISPSLFFRKKDGESRLMPPADNAAEDQLILIAEIPFPLSLFPIHNGAGGHTRGRGRRAILIKSGSVYGVVGCKPPQRNSPTFSQNIDESQDFLGYSQTVAPACSWNDPSRVLSTARLNAYLTTARQESADDLKATYTTSPFCGTAQNDILRDRWRLDRSIRKAGPDWFHLQNPINYVLRTYGNQKRSGYSLQIS